MRAAIAAGHPLAAEAGWRILEDGGNAADAAIGVAFLQGVVDPAKCGLGGWGTAIHRSPDGRSTAIDFPSVAGALARPDQWADRVLAPAHHGYLPVLGGGVNDVGYGAIGVPTAVAGLAEIHARLGSGRIPWGRLLQPAIRAARDGMVVVDGVLGAGTPEWDWPGAVPLQERLVVTAAGARIFRPGGRAPRVGDVLVQRDLAGTLEHLARDGPEAFRTGAIAGRMAEDLRAGGSMVTADDLATYRPRVGPALRAGAGGWVVDGTPPPESGASVAQVMLALDGRLSGDDPLDPGCVAAIADVLRFAAGERSRELADPLWHAVDVHGMLARARALARDGAPAGPRRSPAPPAEGHTTSVVVMDTSGGTLAMNHSLAGSGGSGVVTEGLGFLYNNTMAGFDAVPGGRNGILPGKARWSAACPTIVAAPGGALHAATGPGGSRAFAAVVEVLLDLLVFGRDPVTAVDLPRYDVRGDTVDVEPAVPARVRDRLVREGWSVSELPGRSVAAVYTVSRDGAGAVTAAADPRWPGSALPAAPIRDARP